MLSLKILTKKRGQRESHKHFILQVHGLEKTCNGVLKRKRTCVIKGETRETGAVNWTALSGEGTDAVGG